jgi:hypothetical protein
MRLARTVDIGQSLAMRLLLTFSVLLVGLSTSPALAIEPAVVVKPTDRATIRTCFHLASIRYMRERTDMMIDPDRSFEPEPGEPSARALFLGWERAHAEDLGTKTLSAEQIDAEVEALGAAFKPLMIAEMRGDTYEDQQRCQSLLFVRMVGNQPTVELTDGLDPADFGDPAFTAQGRLIDDETLAICLGRAEMARQVVGAPLLGDETRFYSLRRGRDSESYDRSVTEALALATKVSTEDYDLNVEDGTGDTPEAAKARVAKGAERSAERGRLCHSYN